MSNRKPFPQDDIDAAASYEASVIARARPNNGGWFATIDIGPDTRISDAVPQAYAGTEQEACEKIKEWLLDDMAASGRLGKKQFQPHWSSYDMKYRLMKYWDEKMAANPKPQSGGPSL